MIFPVSLNRGGADRKRKDAAGWSAPAAIWTIAPSSAYDKETVAENDLFNLPDRNKNLAPFLQIPFQAEFAVDKRVKFVYVFKTGLDTSFFGIQHAKHVFY
ncbi:hypothetical protein WA026_003634 [Henosepilachna vigintioctopunctata]|uniref:Uncharacterized protein n=1 Tax=Henosepilachna vigintioctopunctata TaxID=420089 RepID=A0AAW1UDJ6_9CUCU